jgi:hypothetical protein
MKKRTILLIDAFINLILGILLLIFSPAVIKLLGIPPAPSFYPTILGAVFIGITVALIIEAYRNEPHNDAGLGLSGALSINLCGGIVLFIWLIAGNLEIPLKGRILLWTLDAILVIVSLIEIIAGFSLKKKSPVL